MVFKAQENERGNRRQRSARPDRRRESFWRPLRSALALTLALALTPSAASAFTHIAQEGETLAQLAERYYGRIQMERVVATANHLDRGSKHRIAPGMPLTIPAPLYHRVTEAETWKSLAATLLGDERRHVVLADVNDAKPWIEPQVGQLIRLPYNLSYFTEGGESLATLAYRYLGSTRHAYRLMQYNGLKNEKIEAGRVLLLPLVDLELSAEGRAAASLGATRLRAEARGEAWQIQRNSEGTLAELNQAVRGGRYVTAVELAARLLSGGELARAPAAEVQRLLLEAHVALGSTAGARTACAAYREVHPDKAFDPLLTSPKIIAMCPLSEPADADAESGKANDRAPASPKK